MQTFHLISFGCRASQADGAAIKKQLITGGMLESDASGSGIAIVNTCTVTAAADAEARQMIRRIHRSNPDCKILVTGCYAQRASEEIARMPGVAWVVGNSHKHRVAGILLGDLNNQRSESDSLVTLSKTKNPGISGSGECGDSSSPSGPQDDNGRAQILAGEIGDEFHFAPVFADDRTRPTLKIQDGCNARCAFCVIPSVRGASRSLEPSAVIEQIRSLERDGTREVVLSGINLGSYGRDLEPRIGFLNLLERILQETAIDRIRISSIEPMDVSPELIRLVASEPRMARHFHVPLQSGSDRILRLMNRRYWTAQYAEHMLSIHEQIPNCGIGADVMVGFPGETEQDHARSLDFIASLPFTYLHIFPYSVRPGTAAAARSDQIDGRRAHERGNEIRSLIAEKQKAFLNKQVGRQLSVLTLHKNDGDGIPSALSTNYLKVSLPGSNLPPDTLVDVQIARACVNGLVAYQH